MVVKTTFAKSHLLLLTIFVCVMICFGFFIYQNTAQTVKNQLGNKCIGIASAIAVLIEDDIDGFLKFSKTMDTQSDYYKTIYQKMNRIRHENEGNIAFLYAEIRVSDTMIMYVLDGEDEDDPLFSPPGSVDTMTDSELEAYRTHRPFIPTEFVTNSYGTLLTCYVPLSNPSTGEFIGLVGVDVSVDQYSAVMQNQLITIALSIALLILVLFVTLALSSSRMEKLVSRDNLTGAYNRSHFIRALRQQLKYYTRKGKPVTIFMADLDHFKRINDTYGHAFGDIVLSTVSDTIGKIMRRADCFSRYGGEEFAAFLPDTDITVAEDIAERVRLAVENAKTFNEECYKYVQITISIGVVQSESHRSAQELLALADKALYQAKRTRNSVEVYRGDALQSNHPK